MRLDPRRDESASRALDHENPTVGILVEPAVMALRLLLRRVHATFIQKVFICMFAGFLAASLFQWGKVFIEGADDALNKGYEHHSVMGPSKP